MLEKKKSFDYDIDEIDAEADRLSKELGINVYWDFSSVHERLGAMRTQENYYGSYYTYKTQDLVFYDDNEEVVEIYRDYLSNYDPVEEKEFLEKDSLF